MKSAPVYFRHTETVLVNITECLSLCVCCVCVERCGSRLQARQEVFWLRREQSKFMIKTTAAGAHHGQRHMLRRNKSQN